MPALRLFLLCIACISATYMHHFFQLAVNSEMLRHRHVVLESLLRPFSIRRIRHKAVSKCLKRQEPPPSHCSLHG
jgi:hypothetical protein